MSKIRSTPPIFMGFIESLTFIFPSELDFCESVFVDVIFVFFGTEAFFISRVMGKSMVPTL